MVSISRRDAEEKGDAALLNPFPVIPGLTRDLASFARAGRRRRSPAPDHVRGDAGRFGDLVNCHRNPW